MWKSKCHWFERRNARLASFTLLEVLVVITVITMLVALLTPALQSAKEQARTLKCMNNLHQIGIAVALYGHDTGYYVSCGYDEKYFACRLSPYLGASGADLDHLSPMFECPSVIKEPGQTNPYCRYSMHDNIAIIPSVWEYGKPPPIHNIPARPYPITSRTSELIILADSGNAPSYADISLEYVDECYQQYNPATANDPIKKSLLAPEGWGSFCFRHNFKTRANLLFLDGHVSSAKDGEILERNVKLDSLDMN